jgi:outer membrane protein
MLRRYPDEFVMRKLLKAASVSLALALATLSLPAAGQEVKLGYVSYERIMRDSAPAKAASKKLEAEFTKRDRELQDLSAKLKAAAERFEKDAPVLGEADRARRQRELTELDRDLQRRQREFREDLNQRRNEELQGVVERAGRVIRQIAEQEKFDLIVQEAIHASPRIDITERVLRALDTPSSTPGK